MSLNKIDIGVIERIAPNKGPTSSIDFNSTMEEIRNSLAQISSVWNDRLQPLLDTLPGGLTGINKDKRTEDPNPFINGFDGSQVYTDLTSTSVTDDGRFYDEPASRPLTIKETFNKIQNQLNENIQDLEVKIAQVGKQTGITPRQKQAIGSRIFDPGTDSSPTSIDGKTSLLERAVDQIALDISGSENYILGNGTQSLMYSILDQMRAIQNSHDYDPNFNTMSHRHLKFHEHKYHVKPIGALNGINREYYLPSGEEFITGTLRVIINGSEQPQNITYTPHANNKGFTITSYREPLENDGVKSNDMLWIHYDVDSTGEL
ncbi:MAG: hypothetical protein PHY47_00265 [Lachnospiraceae bacterium]|nr:hypothetical protein [Lachnospiraceae bacterium]